MVTTFSYDLAGQEISSKIVVNDASKLQKIGFNVYHFEDTSRKLELNNILADNVQTRFKKNGKAIFNCPATKSAYWFKLEIQNKSNEDLWLEVGKPFSSWYLDVYLPDSSNNYGKPLLLGALRKRRNTIFPSSFIVNLENKEIEASKTYYIRVSGDFPKTHIFQIGSKDAFIKKAKLHDAIQAGFVGIMLAMILYNLFLFFSTKEYLYLLYLLFSLLVLFIVPFDSGDSLSTQVWLWKYHFVWHNSIYLIISIFTFIYLELRQKANKFFWWILFLTIILSFAIPIVKVLNLIEMPSLVNIFQPTLMIYYISLISSGIYVWYKGFKNARFYVLGWFFSLSSAFIFVFTINGLLPINLFTEHALYFGFALESIMFAWALGDKWNTLKKEKERVQAKNIILVEKQNELLEVEVQKRTKELKDSNQEIQSQAEELIAQEEEIRATNEELEKKVQHRTEILENQRDRLKKYAFANSHQVRGPLARILGLIYLIQQEDEKEKFPANTHNYITLLEQSSEELDTIIKEMSALLHLDDFDEKD